jgi:hypothetical protein
VTDDAATTTDPTQASDVGERRRAIQAERERSAQSDRDEPPPSTPPTSLVRPYAPITAPTGSIAVSGAGEDPESGPQEDADVEDVEDGTGGDLDVSAGASEEPVEPEPAEPGEPAEWSLFTPVVPPAPRPYHDVGSYPSTYASPTPPEPVLQEPAAAPAESPELREPSVEPAAEDAPWPVPPAPDQHRAAGADEWAQLSLRVGDDDAWLSALRRSLVAADDLGPDPGDPARPEPVVPREDDADGDVHAGDVVAGDVMAEDLVQDPFAPVETLQAEARDNQSDSDDRPGDGTPLEEVLPVVPDEPAPVVDDRPPVAPSSPFRRPAAERLTRAFGDDPAARPHGRIGEEADDGHEHVRGTLEPVLRRSTARAKATPVIQPPEPADSEDAFGVVRAAPVSWAEAMAANVTPSGKRGSRRLARARHESAGTEDYRPRPGADRSLTLLVLGMLLVLAVLVGLAVWAFWPRVVGARSVPPVSVTGMPAPRHA